MKIGFSYMLAAAAILIVATIAFGQPNGQAPSPAPSPAAPLPAAEPTDDSPVAEQPALGKEIFARSNALRASEGLSELRTSDQLAKAAREFAAFMARTGKYGHTADDRQPRERVEAQDYEACIVAENIGQQFGGRPLSVEQLARAFVEGWASSKAHRANLLDPDLSEIGVAVARREKDGHYYAVQLFGRPQSESIRVEIENSTSALVKYELGGGSYELAGQLVRVHQLCRPAEFTFQLPQADGGERSFAQTVKAKSRLVIKRDEADQLVVVRSVER